MDKDTLKRVLRYVRKRKTVLHKHYTLLLSGGGRTGPVMKLEGQIAAYSEMTAYLEKLLREVEDVHD